MPGSTIANLVVSLEANLAKFSNDFHSAGDVVAKSMNNMAGAIGGVQGKLIDLAAGVFSVGKAVESVKGAIELGDELKQMSDSTGIAIDKLDQLSIVAKLNGSNLDGIAVGFKGLTKSMVESGDASSKQAQLFTALGVSVKDAQGNLRGTDEVMGDVAKALNNIENETTRAAVGTAIFGKGYLAIAATLRNFEADQANANKVLANFGPVSAQAANLADDLGDKFTLLGEGGKRALLGGLVPGMAAVATAVDQLIDKGGGFQRGFGTVVSTVAEFAAKAFVILQGSFERLGTAIGAVLASIATRSLDPLRQLDKDLDAIDARTSAKVAAIATSAKFAGLDNGDAVSRAAGAAGRLADANAKAAISSAKLNSILADAKPTEFDKAMEALVKNVAGADAELLALTSQTKDIVPLQKMLAEIMASDLWKKAPQSWRDQFEAMAKVGIKTQELTVDFKKMADESAQFAADRKKQYEDWSKQQSDVIDQTVKLVRTYTEANDTLEREFSVIGENELAHRRLAATLEYEAQKRKILDDRTLVTADALDYELTKLEEQYARRQNLIGAAFNKEQLVQQTGILSDVLYGFFQKGTGYAKQFWASFKDMALRALAEIAAKQIIVSIVGAVSGTGGGLANAAGSAGSGLGGIGSLLGSGGSIASLFGEGAGAFSAAAGAGVSAGLETIQLGITAGLEGIGGIAGLLGAASTLVPFAAIAAIAVPLLIKAFDKGPASRTATFASGDLGNDKSRDAVFSSKSAFGAFGIAKDFWLGPEAGSAFKPTLDAIQQLDNTIAGLVGKDVTKQIIDALDAHTVTVGLGKEGTDINASGGPAEILKDRYVTVLSAIDERLGVLAQSFEGTGQELANFVVGLVALKQQLGDAFDNLSADDVRALGDAFGGIDKLAAGLASLNANFKTDADSAIAAQQKLTDSFKDLGLAVPETHQAFLDLLSSFPLATDEGRKLYASVLNLSGAFVQVNGTATQAAAALKASFADLDAAVADFKGIAPEQQKATQLDSAIQALITSTGNTGFSSLLQQQGSLGFASNLANISHDDFARYSTENQTLIREVIRLATQARGTQTDTGQSLGADYYKTVFGFDPNAQDAGKTAADTSAADVEKMLQLFDAISGKTTGNYGEKLGLEIKLVTGAIADAANKNLPGVAALLGAVNQKFGASLTLFQSLSTRYTDKVAEELVKLTETYRDNAAQLQGNAEGLDALNQVFEEQWGAIISGTAKGVDGAISELARLQQGILSYVDKLKLSDVSPLTPLQKLDQAQRQYQDTLAKAQGGDKGALGDITGVHDAYIKIARDFYASSQQFTDIFNQTVGDLTALGSANLGAADTAMNAADEALLAALPTASKLMSAQDLQDVIGALGATAPPSLADIVPPATPTFDALGAAPRIVPEVADLTASMESAATAAGSATATATQTTQEASERAAELIVDAIYEAMMAHARSNTADTDKLNGTLDRTRAAIVEAITVASK